MGLRGSLGSPLRAEAGVSRLGGRVSSAPGLDFFVAQARPHARPGRLELPLAGARPVPLPFQCAGCGIPDMWIPQNQFATLMITPDCFRMRPTGKPRQITSQSSSYSIQSKDIVRRLSCSGSIAAIPNPQHRQSGLGTRRCYSCWPPREMLRCQIKIQRRHQGTRERPSCWPVR